MPFKLVFLWTDLTMWLIVVGAIGYAHHVHGTPNLSANWRRVFREPVAVCSATILAVFIIIGLADSIHFRLALPPLEAVSTQATPATPAENAEVEARRSVAYSPTALSLLDLLLVRQRESTERSYSAPLAFLGFEKESMQVEEQVTAPDGSPGVQTKTVRDYPRLKFGGAHLTDPERQWRPDVLKRAAGGLVGGLLAALLCALVVAALTAHARTQAASHTEPPTRIGQAWRAIVVGESDWPLRTLLLTVLALCLIAGVMVALAGVYHVFGTDRTGNDVLMQTLKSVRTALVFGALATIATLPLAISLGILAGYFKGWVDDVIQYLYTVLNSIPGVLLIAACVLMLNVYIDAHPDLFETSAERADLRIVVLCVILGVTNWTELCRLLRGETLKLRELEYVQAARAFGVSHLQVMLRHILPNVMHLVLITSVLSFSGIVLLESVLSYLGIGVDPSTNSFGSMINMARLELSRDPVVWWSLAAAFVFMIAIVLPANLFADVVREAFDPRARKFRPTFKPRIARKEQA